MRFRCLRQLLLAGTMQEARHLFRCLVERPRLLLELIDLPPFVVKQHGDRIVLNRKRRLRLGIRDADEDCLTEEALAVSRRIEQQVRET